MGLAGPSGDVFEVTLSGSSFCLAKSFPEAILDVPRPQIADRRHLDAQTPRSFPYSLPTFLPGCTTIALPRLVRMPRPCLRRENAKTDAGREIRSNYHMIANELIGIG